MTSFVKKVEYEIIYFSTILARDRLKSKRGRGQTTEKTTKKTTEKNRDKILAIIKSMPDVTLTELANATGLSVDGVRWNIRKLKNANIIRRVGPDKGGRWEIV